MCRASQSSARPVHKNLSPIHSHGSDKMLLRRSLHCFAIMEHKNMVLTLMVPVAALAWPHTLNVLLWCTSTSRMQGILAIIVSVFIDAGFSHFCSIPKSLKHPLGALGAKLLLRGIHPVAFRLGPVSFVLVWSSRILILLAASCFLVGLGEWASEISNLHKRMYNRKLVNNKADNKQSQKAKEINRRASASARPEQQTRNADQFDRVYDLTDAINRVFRRGQAGVIITDESTERSITIEFYWHRARYANGINVEFAASATVEAAMNFTIADAAKYEHIVLERTIFRDMLLFLHQHANETNEVTSGRRVYRGILP